MFAAIARGDSDVAADVASAASPTSKKSVLNDRNMFAAIARGDAASTDDSDISPPAPFAINDRKMFSKFARADSGSPISLLNDRALFSKLARASSDGSTPSGSPKFGSVGSGVMPTTNVLNDRDMFAHFARGESAATAEDTQTGPFPRRDSSSRSPPSLLNDRALFSQLARGSSDAGSDSSLQNRSSVDPLSDTSPPPAPRPEVSTDTIFFSQLTRGGSPSPDQDWMAKWARGEGETSTIGTTTSNSTAMSSEQIQFAQWARGDSVTVAAAASQGTFVDITSPKPTSGTFRNVAPGTEDSDDDSLVGSETKKKVGMNEHLNAALASLATTEDAASPSASSTNDSISVEDSQKVLSQLGQTTANGRPLMNLELTNGCAPMFACDDPALPLESDLGIYDTKEEQVRCIEQRRSQEIVEKHTMPNIFGPLACPNPALNPDDAHSWNSRTIHATARKQPRGSITSLQQPPLPPSGGQVPALLPVPESPSVSVASSDRHKRFPHSVSNGNLPTLAPPDLPGPLLRKAVSLPFSSVSSKGSKQDKKQLQQQQQPRKLRYLARLPYVLGGGMSLKKTIRSRSHSATCSNTRTYHCWFCRQISTVPILYW